jgi:hypothetical protein
MHIDIHQRRIERYPEHGHRVTSAWQGIRVGRANCREDLFVLYRSAIDEGILRNEFALFQVGSPICPAADILSGIASSAMVLAANSSPST